MQDNWGGMQGRAKAEPAVEKAEPEAAEMEVAAAARCEASWGHGAKQSTAGHVGSKGQSSAAVKAGPGSQPENSRHIVCM